MDKRNVLIKLNTIQYKNEINQVHVYQQEISKMQSNRMIPLKI